MMVMLRRSLIDNRRNSDLLCTSIQSTAYMAGIEGRWGKRWGRSGSSWGQSISPTL